MLLNISIYRRLIISKNFNKMTYINMLFLFEGKFRCFYQKKNSSGVTGTFYFFFFFFALFSSVLTYYPINMPFAPTFVYHFFSF